MTPPPATPGRQPALSALIAAVAVSVLSLPGSAAPGDERPGRFTMSPADGGFVRLDTETGAMSLCTRKDGAFACEAMPDSLEKERREIQRLEAENKALKDEIRQMEEIMGLGKTKPGAEGGPPTDPPRGGLGLPSEKDVDQEFDYVHRMLKKFQEKMRELEKGDGTGQGPRPNSGPGTGPNTGPGTGPDTGSGNGKDGTQL